MKCAVWGSPIEHSLSPVLHRAAYAALGLSDWTYDRRNVTVERFEAALRELGEGWRGLSLTMPLKEAALAAAHDASVQARQTGAANTLVRSDAGWGADNTDVHGLATALRESGLERAESLVIVGSGATARSAVAAAALLGVRRVAFMVRGQPRPQTLHQATAAGLDVTATPMGRWPSTTAVISTVPPASLDGLTDLPEERGVVLDVVYGEGETPLQRAARAQGWTVVEGTEMLLHQAAEQVRLMTGLPAPVPEMRHALAGALARR
ncbi:shikimate dehydrogenase [Intrasporangium chromatireducens Q5-1]|uniref:Shikimate dehydrogenase n=1 Tax=Intrasporangium chromatireducens Q5-1 TaxID=584657 RepID=W9GNB1_9MICO|nr:shikimate dehydrogenase [Intrasporangium chromatireducens]EWT07595.1 shikimate dehydrogenase [Intrasporangium chromatireducens Q5-1]